MGWGLGSSGTCPPSSSRHSGGGPATVCSQKGKNQQKKHSPLRAPRSLPAPGSETGLSLVNAQVKCTMFIRVRLLITKFISESPLPMRLCTSKGSKKFKELRLIRKPALL